MASVEVTLIAAKDLKNVNWRHGPIKPYAVVWVDPHHKCSTRVDAEGDCFPVWDETLVIPLPPGAFIDDTTLYIDIVHAGSEEKTKPLIGSARLKLRDVRDDDVGYGQRTKRSLILKRPSGRPHGKVDMKVSIREPPRRAPDAYYAPPPAYAAPPPTSTREAYAAPPAYGYPYSSPPAPAQAQYQPQDRYYAAAPPPPAGYPSYGAPSYGQSGYGQGGSYSGQPEEKKKSKFGGMGTGLAVGAVAGVLGGLALAEGVDYVEDKIADEAAEKVEDDLAYDDDDGGW